MTTHLSPLEKMASISNVIERMPLDNRSKAQVYYLVAVAALEGVKVVIPVSGVQPTESERKRLNENRELGPLVEQIDVFYRRARQLDPAESYKLVMAIADAHPQASPNLLEAEIQSLKEDLGFDDID